MKQERVEQERLHRAGMSVSKAKTLLATHTVGEPLDQIIEALQKASIEVGLNPIAPARVTEALVNLFQEVASAKMRQVSPAEVTGWALRARDLESKIVKLATDSETKE